MSDTIFNVPKKTPIIQKTEIDSIVTTPEYISANTVVTLKDTLIGWPENEILVFSLSDFFIVDGESYSGIKINSNGVSVSKNGSSYKTLYYNSWYKVSYATITFLEGLDSSSDLGSFIISNIKYFGIPDNNRLSLSGLDYFWDKVAAAIPGTMTGATSSAAGTGGTVPAPVAGDDSKVLKGDGTWGTVDALPVVTSSDNGKVLEVNNGEWAVGNEKIDSSAKGAANGVAELDANGFVLSSQLPSYVDDVLEFDDKEYTVGAYAPWMSGQSYTVGAKVVRDSDKLICIEANSDIEFDSSKWRDATFFPMTGESGKIYVDTTTNITYRWSGSIYVAIGSDLALGETSSTAYRGDRGKAAYDASVVNVDSTPTTNSTHLITSGGVKAALPTAMTGASSSAAGASGLVPAPSAGDQNKMLTGGGTWENAPGARIIDITTTITNVSGSYSNVVEDDRITPDMKAITIDIEHPDVFNDILTVTSGNGSFTLTCNDISGTSDVTVSFIKQVQESSAITSAEFDILNNRLTAVENVVVDIPVNIASTDWALVNGEYTYTWTNGLVTAASGIKVELQDGAESAGIDDFDYDKVSGGVKFISAIQPTGNLPIIIGIVNAKASSIQGFTADDVSSEAISGCSNVEDALENLDSRVGILSNLTTTAKTSVVAAVNEINGKIVYSESIAPSNPTLGMIWLKKKV